MSLISILEIDFYSFVISLKMSLLLIILTVFLFSTFLTIETFWKINKNIRTKLELLGQKQTLDLFRVFATSPL